LWELFLGFQKEFEGTFGNSSSMNQISSKELLQCVPEKFPTTPPSWEDKIGKISKCPFTGKKQQELEFESP
jgi:hypothetical protein